MIVIIAMIAELLFTTNSINNLTIEQSNNRTMIEYYEKINFNLYRIYALQCIKRTRQHQFIKNRLVH